MRSEKKVGLARKLRLLLLFSTLRNPLRTIPMTPGKNKIDRPGAKHQKNNTSERTRKRKSFRDRWMRKYYNLSLSGWLTKPISPLQSEDSDDEPNSTSSPPNPSSQNLKIENGLELMQLTETPNDVQFAVPSIQLFTETIMPQVESDNSPLILPAEESGNQLSSHYLPNMIQRVRQSQLCIDPKDFVIPSTPITVEERLVGTNEIHTTVINTCGMTSLPYTLHDDDPFDTKYPNLKTPLPPISTFFNFHRKRQS